MIDWDRVAEIVDEALALNDEHAAHALIHDRCAGDAELEAACAASYRGRRSRKSTSSPDPLIGLELADFQLVERIGKGGMGVVYRAKQRGLAAHSGRGARDVAVKLLPKIDDAQGHDLALRFRQEVEASLALRHPHIVSVLTSGETDDHLWFAMDFVDGHDLHTELERQRDVRDGRGDAQTLWPRFGSDGYVPAVIRHVAAIAAALDSAHSLQQPLVHRDVKPRNILLSHDGTPMLADFGLAKFLGESGLTKVTTRLGTLNYMSPEQARAKSIEITTRSDLYSLGVVLFEALSLTLPVAESDYATAMQKITTGDITRLDDVSHKISRDLVTICHKCLSLKPDDRYASAADLRADLLRFLRHEAITARPPSLWKRATGWVRRRPKTAWSLVAVVVIAATAGLAREVSRAARLTHVRERLQAVLALDSLEADVSAAQGAAQALDALEREDAQLAFDLREVSGVYRERVAAELRRFKAEVRRTARTVTTTRYGTVMVDADIGAFHARAVALATLFPDDADLKAWSASCKVHITSTALRGAEVFATRVIPSTGILDSVASLGTLPLRAELAAGNWRFTVRGDETRALEFDRSLVVGDEVVIDVEPPRGPPPEFATIPGAQIRLDEPRGIACCHTVESVDVAAFALARTVVSNREYVEFLEDTGHRQPLLWRSCGAKTWRDLPGLTDDESREAFLSRPAVGMGQGDMRAYAEWRGCRLPTHYELEFALRGAEMVKSPTWPTSSDGEASDDKAPAANRFALYLASTLPVDATGYDVGHPFKLFHAFGNVHEATSSSPAVIVDGRSITYTRQRIYLGGAWDATADRFSLDDHGFREFAEQSAAAFLGFRVASSFLQD